VNLELEMFHCIPMHLSCIFIRQRIKYEQFEVICGNILKTVEQWRDNNFLSKFVPRRLDLFLVTLWVARRRYDCNFGLADLASVPV
jgi:hypothetical protein